MNNVGYNGKCRSLLTSIQLDHIIKAYYSNMIWRLNYMRTTLNIDDSLVQKLIEITHEKSKTKAITIAIKDYIKKKKLEEILSYQGNVDIENNWQQLEKEELEEDKHEE